MEVLEVLFKILDFVFGVVIFYQFFYFISIVFSPHPDTSLRVFGNVVICSVLYFGCEFVVSSFIFCAIIQIVVAPVNLLVYNYLRSIKYQS